jgi:hypothetical protein
MCPHWTYKHIKIIYASKREGNEHSACILSIISKVGIYDNMLQPINDLFVFFIIVL